MHRPPVKPPSAARPLALWIATASGVGYAPVAPGTFGSAAGLLVFLALARLPLGLYALAALALGWLGVWAASESERAFGRSDDGRIVIDEVVGQLVTLAPLVALGRSQSWVLLVTGFVAFRVFDIWKPGPVRWAERRFAGGAGVMADDLLAGVLAALPTAGLALVLDGAAGGVTG